jgi:hypothetical protein
MRRLIKQCQCTNIKRAQGFLVNVFIVFLYKKPPTIRKSLTIYEL